MQLTEGGESMKILNRLLLVSLVWGVVTLGRAQTAQSPFSIVIESEKQSFKAGSDVWIRLRLTNLTKQDLSVPVMDVNGVDAEYEYEVRGPGGTPANKVPNPHPEIQIGSSKSGVVKAGQSTAWEEIRVSKVYNMTQPGQCSIHVSRPLPNDGVVKSNTITVTVTP